MSSPEKDTPGKPQEGETALAPDAMARTLKDARRLLRIQVPVIAVLAEKRMKLAEVLNLSIGSIIQLDKPSDDLLDLMVNDQRVGRGETVRIGENFGLQLVEIGNVKETIRKLAGKEAEGEAEPAEDEKPEDAGAEETGAEAQEKPADSTP